MPLLHILWFTNKTDHHDITKILLKVVLNTINPQSDFSSLASYPQEIHSGQTHEQYPLLYSLLWWSVGNNKEILFVFQHYLLIVVQHAFSQLVFAHMADDIRIYIYFENGQQLDHGHGNKWYDFYYFPVAVSVI